MRQDDKPEEDETVIAAEAGEDADIETETETETETEAEVEAEEVAAPSPEDRVAELNDQLLRTLAELENTRKRAERDRGEALKFGAMSFARDMLGVADNLQRALKAMQDINQQDGEKGDEQNTQDTQDAMRGLLDGVAATERDLLAALARHKVTPLVPMGEKFDPNMHEAMFEAPGTGQENGTIIEIIETGYMMEERLLRPAKVGIAKD